MYGTRIVVSHAMEYKDYEWILTQAEPTVAQNISDGSLQLPFP